jgi:hypothetical protein
MPLKFPGKWRFEPPADGEFIVAAIPDRAVEEFVEMVDKLAPQADRWDTLELFKSHFAEAAGGTHWRSSGLFFARGDLIRDAQAAAKNAPLFVEAFNDACRAFESEDEDRYAPDAAAINKALEKHGVGLEIRGERLELRGAAPPLVTVNADIPTLAEQSIELIQVSLHRASDLLQQGRWREAVQESIWLLETVATAFRGVATATGSVEGKYFNKIVKELRDAHRGGVTDRVLDWATSLHGYLSSPTGGGVRHGLDLQSGMQIEANEARLFCNLIRSYVGFLLSEHERLAKRR